MDDRRGIAEGVVNSADLADAIFRTQGRLTGRVGRAFPHRLVLKPEELKAVWMMVYAHEQARMLYRPVEFCRGMRLTAGDENAIEWRPREPRRYEVIPWQREPIEL